MSKTTSDYSKTLSMLNIVGLREAIEDLMKKESKYRPVASVCSDYLTKLNEGQNEEMICTSFINDLSKVAVHESAKDTLYNLSKTIDEHKRDISIVESLCNMKNSNNGYVVPMVESVLVDYMCNKNSDTRTAARQTLSLFEGIKEINSILENLSFDEYEERTGNVLKNSSLNESMLPKKEKTYTQEEVDAMMAKTKEDAINEHEELKSKEVKSISSVDTHIELDSTIKRILAKESRNESLKTFCEQYIQALNNGQSEEKLYESFISGISHWNYLNAVDTELTALNSRISKYQQEIDLKKILKIMESTGSYYIVPLIEGVIVDYVNDKSMAKKAVLKQRLQAFEYDPFVRDILNVVMLDQSLANTVYLGESVENINSIVHTEKIFSPVKYVKENECVFNVKGIYYNRKGNTITKLSKSGIANLDESFKTLCNLINHPAVKIDELENSISIFEGKDFAKVTESSIELNGKPVSTVELANIANMSHLMNEHKEGFYAAVNMINEKFNDIAYIDFVKRIAMNESNGKSVDVFRIKNNIFVNTTDANLKKTTFYRNVNPIQCRNYINEHMEINVSSLFEDILPNQHAILEGIEETKGQYETYLEDLKEKKESLLKLKDESDDTSEIEEAIKLVDDEIADVEKDYKAYQEDSEKYTNGDDEDKTSEDPDSIATDDTDTADSDDTNTEEEPTESPEEMEQPIEEPADAFEDEASPFDADFDVVATPETGAAPAGKDQVQVLRISYESNVKTGKLSNRGTAFVVIPSVDANGDIKDETKTVTFYLGPDKKPIVNNEYMPLSVYNAIVNAINSDPDTAAVEVTDSEASQDDSANVSVVSSTEITTTPSEESESLIDDTMSEPLANDTVDSSVDTLSSDSSSSEEPQEQSTDPSEEPMDGLDQDPDNIDVNLDNFTGDEDTTSQEDSELDSLFNSETNDDNVSDDDLLSAADGIEDETDNTPVDSVDKETPAETAKRDPGSDYPIELGLNVNDIKPISKDDFEDELSNIGIEHSESEADSDCLTLKFNNKAEVYALKNYFKEWKNFSEAQFCTFFPELKNCINNKPSTIDVAPANESLKIKGVKAINESVLFRDNSKGKVKVVLPYTADYAAMFESANKFDNHIVVITENFKETKDLYKTLSTYAASKNGNIDEDAKMFLERYQNEKEFKNINESNVTIDVPYNGFLEQKLKAKGIFVGRVDESMRIAIRPEDCKKTKKLLESFYGEKTPVSVKDFFQLSEELLNEGVKITIEDTKTGKKVTLDTDDIDTDKNVVSDSSDESQEMSDPFKDVNTTFETSESALFSSDDDSSDEDEDKKDDKKDDESKEDSEKSNDEKSEESENSKESEESSDNSDEKSEETKPEKKFKFKVRKKQKIGESVNTSNKVSKLNESEETKIVEPKVQYAEPNVLDWVSCPAGNGQIIAKLPMSNNFIINVNGRTLEYSPKQVKMLRNRLDTVECPYKYDKETLKGLFEQMVHCGLFMNNNRLTPNNCFVKYSEYIAAKEEDDVRMIVENEQVFAKKKYIKVTEDVNEFANVNDYVEGVEITSTGEVLRNVLINLKDFNSSNGTSDPVRTLITLEDGSKSLINLPANSVRPIQM